MAGADFERLEGALRRVEQELHDVKARLAKLEGTPDPIKAPPVIFDVSRWETKKPEPEPPTPHRPIYEQHIKEFEEAEKPPEVVFVPTVGRTEPTPSMAPLTFPPQVSRPVTPEAEPKSPLFAKITEQVIGEQLMGRAAAVVIVLALIFFIAVNVSRGNMSPWWIVGSIATVCAGFVGLGIRMRGEKEGLGQILVGIGSCGLYIDFAGAYSYQALLSGEALVVLFVLLSLLNFGYSLWTKSRTFLAIGVIGGLCAAVMPTQKDNFAMNAILHIVIVAVAAFVAKQNRWTGSAMWLWFFSTIALIPMFLAAPAVAPWEMQVGILYVSTLLAVVAVGFGERSWIDPQRIFVPMAVVIATLIGHALKGGYTGACHMAAFGLAILVLSWIYTHQEEARSRFVASGLFVMLALAPMGLTALQATWVYALVSIVCSLAVWQFKLKVAISLSWIEFGLSIVAYLLLVGLYAPTWSLETALNLTIIASLAIASWATSASLKDKNILVVATVLAVWVLSTRLSYLVFAGSPMGWSGALSVAVGWIGFVLATNIAARLYRSNNLAVVGACLSGVTMAYYVFLISADALPFQVDLPLVFASLVAFGSSVFLFLDTEKQDNPETTVVLATTIGVPMYARLVWLLLQRLGVDPSLLPSSTWLIVSMSVSALALWRKWVQVSILSAIVLGIGTLTYLASFENIKPSIYGQETVLMVGYILGVAGLLVVGQKAKKLTTELAGVLGSLFATGFYGRLCYIWLERSGVDHSILLASTGLVITFTLFSIGAKMKWSLMAGLAAVLLAATGAAYLVDFGNIKEAIRMQESVFLLGFLGATTGVAFLTDRTKKLSIDNIAVIASMFALGFYARLIYIWLGQCGVDSSLVLPTTGLVATLSVLGLGFWKKWEGLAHLAASTLALSGLAYVACFENIREAIVVQEALLMGGFMALTILVVVLAKATEKLTVDILGVLGWLFGMGFYSRLAYLGLSRCGMTVESSMVIAWVFATLILSRVGARYTFKGWIALSWFVLLASFAAYMSTISGFRGAIVSMESVELLGLLAGVVSVINATGRASEDEVWRMNAGALMCWWATSRLLIVWITSLNSDFNFNFSVTISWAFYAVVILAIGFALKTTVLRYWGLAIIGLTVLKVFLIDLATLDSMVRVIALFFTGIAMLLMAAWYRRNKSLFEREADR